MMCLVMVVEAAGRPMRLAWHLPHPMGCEIATMPGRRETTRDLASPVPCPSRTAWWLKAGRKRKAAPKMRAGSGLVDIHSKKIRLTPALGVPSL